MSSDPNISLKRTPLFELHKELGAKIVPFAGFEMPVQYEGLVAEHEAVRNAVGLFDVSHMGEFRVSGRGAPEVLNTIVTGDVTAMKVGAALYTLVCRQDGGIIDDVIVYRVSKDSYFICVNASNRDKDAAWFRSQIQEISAASGSRVDFEDVSDFYAQIAVQGPKSYELLRSVVDTPLSGLAYYHFTEAKVFGTPAIVARTGYTGELGYELYFEASHARRIWMGLTEAGKTLGVRPCGLGSRDTLRVEVGMGLYGQDMDESHNPLDSAVSWAVAFGKSDFIGKSALEEIKQRDSFQKLVGYSADKGAVPRSGHTIFDKAEGGSQIGLVTSGIPSPSVTKRVGFCRLDRNFAKTGTEIWIDIRGNRTPATVGSRTFYTIGTAKKDVT
jgi:aminomethyltransferase